MNILLTGGSGFFGSYLKPALQKQGNVTTIGISQKDDIYADLSKEIPVLEDVYDLVVHAAGKAHVIPKNMQEERSFFDINTTGTENLLKALDRSSRMPAKFVFISTVAVYGLFEGDNINETSPLKAKDPYGKSKRIAENIIFEWGKKNNVKITILRLPLLIGKNAPGNLGAMINAIKKERFAIIGKGDAKRSMVFARDVAKFIPEIAGKGGIYNLTDGYHPSFEEIAEAIGTKLQKRPYWRVPEVIAVAMAKGGDLVQAITGKELPINSLRLMKMTSSLTFNDDKARQAGWNPSRILDIVDEWL